MTDCEKSKNSGYFWLFYIYFCRMYVLYFMSNNLSYIELPITWKLT